MPQPKSPKTNTPSDKLSRRDFLNTTSTAAASLTLAALSPVTFAAQSPLKKVRLGIVGGGNFGNSYQFHEHPDCIVEAVSDLLPERRAALMKKYRCSKSYHSLEELVRDPNIDAVAIFTDGQLHTLHVEMAMRHGKHAMTAVPAAWGTLEDCHYLRETVEKFGHTYMLCETGYFQPEVMAARDFYKAGAFGELFYSESEYQHPRTIRPDTSTKDGVKILNARSTAGKRTWRYGMAPMHYPTHNTAKLISVTGERLTHVTCHGYGDGSPYLLDNPQGNPFWDESAFFTTDRGHAFRLKVWWHGAFRFAQRAEWNGDKMSLHMEQSNGEPPMIVKSTGEVIKDSVGYAIAEAEAKPFIPIDYYKTELLPEELRHKSGHWNSHCFLTHEFIDSVARQRKPAIDLYEALAYTAPGIVAHDSAMRDGERLTIPSFDPTA